ncbi:MAG: zf-TFIIB domain-containing protein [Deltaproteobacteria bacterium]|nr:zf-TFIIB domain-containing protein [Deltaproteobacteria bacterium]
MIVECPGCHSRYDVTGRPPGTRARCRCGTMFELPEPKREAASLSCPACGGGVAVGDRRCGFCEAELLVKACPRCFARIFAGAKHCNMCGAEVEIPAAANPDGDARRLRCPRCDGETVSRLVGDLLIDECGDCHGIWLDNQALKRLLEEVEEGSVKEFVAPGGAIASATGASSASTIDAGSRGRMYVKCPECDNVMNRKNFARSSGVIIDQCKAHGTWFDGGELPRVVDFVAAGGLGEARKRQLRDLQDARRRAKSEQFSAAMRAGSTGRGYGGLGDSLFDRRSPVVSALGLIAFSVLDG